MLRRVKEIRDEACRRLNGSDKLDLQTIANVFEDLTILDRITFVRFDATTDNPIWGRYSRWSQHPGVYAPPETMLEIAYASHLEEPWRRFVVCKELCHALDISEGPNAVSQSGMTRLVDAFALVSASNLEDAGKLVDPLQMEIFAEFGAVELLFPLPSREKILAHDPDAGKNHQKTAALAAEYNLPDIFVVMGLATSYNEIVKMFMGEQ